MSLLLPWQHASNAVSVDAEAATGTGTANGASISIGVNAGSASGLGAAYGATVIIAVGPGFATGHPGWRGLQAKRKRAALRPVPVRPPVLVYALAETATGYGVAHDALVEIEWTLDEWLLGLTDAQLVDTTAEG